MSAPEPGRRGWVKTYRTDPPGNQVILTVFDADAGTDIEVPVRRGELEAWLLNLDGDADRARRGQGPMFGAAGTP